MRLGGILSLLSHPCFAWIRLYASRAVTIFLHGVVTCTFARSIRFLWSFSAITYTLTHQLFLSYYLILRNASACIYDGLSLYHSAL